MARAAEVPGHAAGQSSTMEDAAPPLQESAAPAQHKAPGLTGLGRAPAQRLSGRMPRKGHELASVPAHLRADVHAEAA